MFYFVFVWGLGCWLLIYTEIKLFSKCILRPYSHDCHVNQEGTLPAPLSSPGCYPPIPPIVKGNHYPVLSFYCLWTSCKCIHAGCTLTRLLCFNLILWLREIRIVWINLILLLYNSLLCEPTAFYPLVHWWTFQLFPFSFHRDGRIYDHYLLIDISVEDCINSFLCCYNKSTWV